MTHCYRIGLRCVFGTTCRGTKENYIMSDYQPLYQNTEACVCDGAILDVAHLYSNLWWNKAVPFLWCFHDWHWFVFGFGWWELFSVQILQTCACTLFLVELKQTVSLYLSHSISHTCTHMHAVPHRQTKNKKNRSADFLICFWEFTLVFFALFCPQVCVGVCVYTLSVCVRE